MVLKFNYFKIYRQRLQAKEVYLDRWLLLIKMYQHAKKCLKVAFRCMKSYF